MEAYVEMVVGFRPGTLRIDFCRHGGGHAKEPQCLVHKVCPQVVEYTRAGQGLFAPGAIGAGIGAIAVEVSFVVHNFTQQSTVEQFLYGACVARKTAVVIDGENLFLSCGQFNQFIGFSYVDGEGFLDRKSVV